MIQHIPIDKLHPHPDNPRKDLGDLTELVESIKAQGVLQNLTVVELDKYEKGYYRVVIGHRRLEAAKMAGLTELPCVVSTMDYKTQIATMLLENMQRNDLTPYEQAKGFQLLLDFGDSIQTISERTGFSETTVRRRVKLLELDENKFLQSLERGGTMADYIKLNEIEDIEARNKVLESIGTSNFKWELDRALEAQERAARKAALIAELDEWATPIDDATAREKQLKYVANFWRFMKDDDFEKPTDADSVEYFYAVNDYNINLYRVRLPDDEQTSRAIEDDRYEKMRELGRKLEEVTGRAYKLRFNFVKEYPGLKKHAKDIMDFLLRSLLLDDYCDFDQENLLELLGIERPEEPEDDENWKEPSTYDLIKDEYAAHPERVMLAVAWCASGDSFSEGYFTRNYSNYTYEHFGNETLNLVYDFLQKLGYEMSDEEKALRDGTHELFSRKDTDG